VERELQRLPNKLSAGPDSIPPYLLRRVATPLALPLSLIFSRSLQQGVLPREWKMAIIKPLFKKGDKARACNYRPISLTSCVCKVFESMLKTELTSFLEHHNLFSACQFGFRSERSTVSQLTLFYDELIMSHNKNESTDIVYIDFMRAFDTVCHSKLMLKLAAYGVADPVLRWLSSFLEGRSQRVQVNSSLSEEVPVRSGVPQGTVLGPLLFLLYVNDLPSQLHVPCKMFADDLKLHVSFANNTNEGDLDDALRSLEEWTQRWQLRIAVEKCSVMHVGKNNPRQPRNLCGAPLPVASQMKDLGVIFSETLDFKPHITAMVSKASRMSNIVFRVLRSKDPLVLSKAFKVFVRPHLEYASCVWSPQAVGEKDLVESVQRRFTRRLFARCRLAPQPAIERLKLLQLQPLERRRIEADLLLVHKIFSGKAGIDPSCLFLLLNSRTRGHRYRVKFRMPPRSNLVQNSFAFRTIRTWNDLPIPLVSSTSSSFKSGLKNCKLSISKYVC